MADNLSPEEVLIDQAKALDLKVDNRWSVDTLAEKVLEAQTAKAEAEKAEFGAAKKVPIRLLRDAFPVADEKHLIGEIIEVPVPLAKHWISCGVAERADPFPGE